MVSRVSAISFPDISGTIVYFPDICGKSPYIPVLTEVMKKPTRAYTLTLELLIYVKSKGSLQNNYQEAIDEDGYYRSNSADSFKLFQDVTVIAKGVGRSLSTGARALLDQISDELKMNNALWYHEPTKYEYELIKELRDKKILVKTENPYIFYVNPMYMRRGSLSSVLALTMHLLRTVSKPTLDHIHDLRYTKAILIDKIEAMNDTGVIDIGYVQIGSKVKGDQGDS